MQESGLWVDNALHRLHMDGYGFPCDRDVEALALWNAHPLLLSSDTDCLSLWDRHGLIRTARVGVYPQDMAVQGDAAYVCGGADGRLHRLSLPSLIESAEFALPGMPERLCIREDTAYILTLLPDADVETALLTVALSTGRYAEIARFPGLPGAIAADQSGLWVGVSGQICRYPMGAAAADIVIEDFGLARRITTQAEGIRVYDALEETVALITYTPRPAVEVLHRGVPERFIFI